MCAYVTPITKVDPLWHATGVRPDAHRGAIRGHQRPNRETGRRRVYRRVCAATTTPKEPEILQVRSVCYLHI